MAFSVSSHRANAALRRDPSQQSLCSATDLQKMAIILVVEDDIFLRELAESMIQDWGHTILSASDVPQAMLHLRSGAPIDALFTDVYLKAEIHGGCDIAREAVLMRPS